MYCRDGLPPLRVHDWALNRNLGRVEVSNLVVKLNWIFDFVTNPWTWAWAWILTPRMLPRHAASSPRWCKVKMGLIVCFTASKIQREIRERKSWEKWRWRWSDQVLWEPPCAVALEPLLLPSATSPPLLITTMLVTSFFSNPLAPYIHIWFFFFLSFFKFSRIRLCSFTSDYSGLRFRFVLELWFVVGFVFIFTIFSWIPFSDLFLFRMENYSRFEIL